MTTQKTRVRRGESKSFFGGQNFLLGLTFLLLPRWVLHFQSHNIFDSDGVFLHMQDRNLARKGGSKAWKQAYYLPTSADAMLRAFRSWYDAATSSGGNPCGMTEADGIRASNTPSPSSSSRDLGRDQLLDRYHSHTVECRICQRGLLTMTRVEALITAVMVISWLFVFAVGFQMLMPGVAQQLPASMILANKIRMMTAVLVSLVAYQTRRFVRVQKQNFFFKDWVHAYVP